MAERKEISPQYEQLLDSIIAKRKATGMSQKALAEKCKLPQSTIARMEARLNIPSVETLLVILAAMNCSLEIK